MSSAGCALHESYLRIILVEYLLRRRRASQISGSGAFLEELRHKSALLFSRDKLLVAYPIIWTSFYRPNSTELCRKGRSVIMKDYIAAFINPIYY
jgi:hypothetical protein